MRSTSCCRGGTVTGAASTLPGFRLRASFSVRGEFAGTSTQSILCSRILDHWPRRERRCDSKLPVRCFSFS